ncbi:MAG: DUF6472 family protein [Ruminococcus sp.]|nr:DUF6472 family protein [Ruminococcus sp.]
MKTQSQCDMCAYYVYDDDYDGYICEVNLDEDELSRYLEFGNRFNCPYFHLGDDYAIARKQ